MPRRSKMVEMRYEFSKIVELNTYRDAEPTTRPSTKAEKLEKSEYPEHRICYLAPGTRFKIRGRGEPANPELSHPSGNPRFLSCLGTGF